MEKELISERQAALLLGVSPQTIKNWREKDKLEGIFVEKKYPNISRVVYDKSKLLDWVKSF